MRRSNARPGRNDALVFDDEQRGLGVRITSGGGKSYVAQYTFAGSKRRVPLGSCSAISLAAAREAVRTILGDAARGVDTAAERKAKLKAAADAVTLAGLIDRWDKLHLSAKRANYSTASTSALRRAFARHLDQARRLPRPRGSRSCPRRAFRGRQDRDGWRTRPLWQRALWLGHSTRDAYRRSVRARARRPDCRRERVVSDDEILAIWAATEGPGAFNGIVRMLMLTGQRREEVAGMKWDEIAPDLSVWTIPASWAKNGVAHVVPLSAQAQTVLRAAPRINRGANENSPRPRLPRRTGVFSGWSKSKARLDGRSGVNGWTLHDLRRTTATGLQKLGVRLEVTESVLNHVSGSRAGIVGVYQRHEWSEEKRAALNAWGEHMAAIVEGRTAAGNVTRLRRSA